MTSGRARNPKGDNNARTGDGCDHGQWVGEIRPQLTAAEQRYRVFNVRRLAGSERAARPGVSERSEAEGHRKRGRGAADDGLIGCRGWLAPEPVFRAALGREKTKARQQRRGGPKAERGSAAEEGRGWLAGGGRGMEDGGQGV